MKNSTFKYFSPANPSSRAVTGDCVNGDRRPKNSTLKNIMEYSRTLEIRPSKKIQYFESILN